MQVCDLLFVEILSSMKIQNNQIHSRFNHFPYLEGVPNVELMTMCPALMANKSVSMGQKHTREARMLGLNEWR